MLGDEKRAHTHAPGFIVSSQDASVRLMDSREYFARRVEIGSSPSFNVPF
jgi:hypothetical protein